MRHKTIITLSICLAFSGLHARELRASARGAVDASGVRHRTAEYHGKSPPWVSDIATSIGPEYSPRDRSLHNQGTGLFRLTLDLKKGTVLKITVAQSTGVSTLDRSALAALRQWRWKPGKWKEVDIPMTFRMSTGPPRLPPGAVRLPNR
jgi:TonB family protein